MDEASAQLEALRSNLEEAERAYGQALAAVDALAAFALPAERLPELPNQIEKLNALWERAPRPEAAGLGGALRQRAFDAVAPALDRQRDFNSYVVQVLNGQVAESGRLDAHLRDLVAALVRYLQRLMPLVDAHDRLSGALATARSELVLEAFDRRLESLGRRVEGLLALKDRLSAQGEELRGLTASLAAAAGGAAGAPSAASPETARAALAAADDAAYTAFEERFRGDPAAVREKLEGYVSLFAGLGPVADLGCGRGEFLDLLRERGIEGQGVEGNARFAQACRERGLAVEHGDLVAFLRARRAGSLGGVFAAQVAEHLPPPVLLAMLREAYRALRPDGLLLLETVNPRSVFALVEVFNRDLTHERPLHPETLRFLAAAQGFADVRIELRAPVEATQLLRPVPEEGLPARAADALNENVRRLNDLLFGPQEYALLARR